MLIQKLIKKLCFWKLPEIVDPNRIVNTDALALSVGASIINLIPKKSKEQTEEDRIWEKEFKQLRDL